MAKSNILTRSKKQKAFKLLQQNQLAEARSLLEQICKKDRGDAESWYALGIINGSLNNHMAAETQFRHVATLLPKNQDVLCNLGVSLEKQGKPKEAISYFEQALAIKGDDPVILANLATALMSLEKYEESIQYSQEAIKLDPNSAESHTNLGVALSATGRLDDAVKCLETAIQINPNKPEPYNNLSLALSSLGQYDAAIEYAKQAITLDSKYVEAYNNLAKILMEMGQLEEAISYSRQAIKLKPDYYKAYNNLGNCLLLQGKLPEATSIYKQALEQNPDYEMAHSNLILLMNYDATSDLESIFTAHRGWSEKHETKIQKMALSGIDTDRQRPLRVGYISPDLCRHSVSFFIEPILAHHNKEDIETYCYAEVKHPDATTQHLQSLADHWRSIVGMPDAEVAALIRNDQIDILVDLAGHTANNRLLVLAQKPAPVQVTYLGYPNTTGMTAMDYRLTDPWADPDGQEQYHSETLIRLPQGFLCYQPPAESPAVASLPAKTAGHITFGSFNNLAKITPEVVTLWAEILKSVPDARLIIKNKSLRDGPTCDRYAALFEAEGIPQNRIELIGWLPKRDDHLGLYNKIDIGLDTFPYNGTTTTCEALWMGVPVITLTGDRHAGRVGTSLLAGLGLKDLIADSKAAYRDLAVALAADREGLAQRRRDLRQQMQNAPLCDGQAFTRELETAYRHMWQRWCEQTTG